MFWQNGLIQSEKKRKSWEQGRLYMQAHDSQKVCKGNLSVKLEKLHGENIRSVLLIETKYLGIMLSLLNGYWTVCVELYILSLVLILRRGVGNPFIVCTPCS